MPTLHVMGTVQLLFRVQAVFTSALSYSPAWGKYVSDCDRLPISVCLSLSFICVLVLHASFVKMFSRMVSLFVFISFGGWDQLFSYYGKYK